MIDCLFPEADSRTDVFEVKKVTAFSPSTHPKKVALKLASGKCCQTQSVNIDEDQGLSGWLLQIITCWRKISLFHNLISVQRAEQQL